MSRSLAIVDAANAVQKKCRCHVETRMSAPTIGEPQLGGRTESKETIMTTTSAFAATPATTNDVRPRPRSRALRSVGAVLGGLVAVFAVTTAAELVMHALGVYPPFGKPMSHAMFALALAYRILFNTAGSALTARLAPDRPMGHAVAIGVVGTVIATAGAVLMWNLGPAWYALANIVIALPCALMGGVLFGARRQTSDRR
jgi:hypothetical protein